MQEIRVGRSHGRAGALMALAMSSLAMMPHDSPFDDGDEPPEPASPPTPSLDAQALKQVMRSKVRKYGQIVIKQGEHGITVGPRQDIRERIQTTAATKTDRREKNKKARKARRKQRGK